MQRKGPRVTEGIKDDPLTYAVNQRDSAVMDMVRQALARRDVMLAFQPVVEAQRPDKVAFYEALIRIRDETGRVIPAREFINEIETQELGRIIDCLALDMGLDTLARVPDLRLSVNMSARSIGYPRWTQTLERGLARDETIAERLILEITESSAMTMPDLIIGFMDEMQLRGITFGLDDFGAGYTAFRYFRDFFFDMLKIDGQFIKGVASNPDNQVLVRALVSIAKHFEMFTVAEMVADAEDAAFLQSVGIDCFQGFYFGAPTIRGPWEEEVGGARRTA